MIPPDNNISVYVGTYTQKLGFVDGQGQGLYHCQMDTVKGSLTLKGLTPGLINPSFLVLHPNQHFLYSVQETAGGNGGVVLAFSIDSDTGTLQLLNQVSSQGADPCHLCIDPNGRFLLVANYTSGTLAMLPIKANGLLEEACDIVQHSGSSLHPIRQAGPHAHSMNLALLTYAEGGNGAFAVAADLGIDQLVYYRVDMELGKLRKLPGGQTMVTPGSGPRHLAFHPKGNFAYLLNELNATLIAYSYNPGQDNLVELQTVPALPVDFTEQNLSAHVSITPSGRYLYASNRGHDSLVIYAIDKTTGRLAYVDHQSCLGKAPRHFAIDPSGTFLLVANQDSNSIVSFRIDPLNGLLNFTGHILETPTPVCIVFKPGEKSLVEQVNQ